MNDHSFDWSPSVACTDNPFARSFGQSCTHRVLLERWWGMDRPQAVSTHLLRSTTSYVPRSVLCFAVVDSFASHPCTKASIPSTRRIFPPSTTRLDLHHPSSLLSCARGCLVSPTIRSRDPGDVVGDTIRLNPTSDQHEPRWSLQEMQFCLLYGRPRGRNGACCPPHPPPTPATWRSLGIPPPSLGPSPGGNTPVCVRHVAIGEGTEWWGVSLGPIHEPKKSPVSRRISPFNSSGWKGGRIGSEPGS